MTPRPVLLVLFAAAASGQVGWRRLAPAARPPARWNAAVMTSNDRRTLLFGGTGPDGALLRDTWSWDGSAWTERVTAAPPVALTGAALAWDDWIGRALLFGGHDRFVPRSDMWEWDGFQWITRTPFPAPPGRGEHAMASLPGAARIVLFGGYDAAGPLADTWEWNGTTWTRRTPARSPSARWSHAMASDEGRRRILLFGGRGPGGAALADTWEWDGTDWTERSPAAAPGPRAGAAFAFDAALGRGLLFGGLGAAGLLDDTWDVVSTAPPPFPVTDWVRRATAVQPPARGDTVMVHDPANGGVLLFGGAGAGAFLGDTWSWDGTAWTERQPAQAPPPRTGHDLAADAARGRVVLFGGKGTDYVDRADTWEWDGTGWSLRLPAASPPARWRHALAYDAARGRTVLYGGAASGSLDDTWEWDGTDWAERLPTRRPALLGRMVYDASRRRCLLVGGLGFQTWEWDGMEWTELPSLVTPTPSFFPGVAFDAARGRVVLFGGSLGRFGALDETWEWEQGLWRQTTPQIRPLARGGQGMAYDPDRARTVLFGGSGPQLRYLDDTWEYVGAPEAILVQGRVLVRSRPGVTASGVMAELEVLQAGRRVATGRTNASGAFSIRLPEPAGEGNYTLRASVRPAGELTPVVNYRYPDAAQTPVLDPDADRIPLGRGLNGGLDILFPQPALLVHDTFHDAESWIEAEALLRLDPADKSRRLGLAARGTPAWSVGYGLPLQSLARSHTANAQALSGPLASRLSMVMQFMRPTPPFDLVAHGAGGLVTRAWLHHHGTGRPVDRVLLFGTPNLGLSWLLGAGASPSLPLGFRQLDPAYLLGDFAAEITETRGARFVLVGCDRSFSCEPECAFPGLPPEDDGLVARVSAHFEGTAPGTFVLARRVAPDRHDELLSDTPNRTLTGLLLAELEALR